MKVYDNALYGMEFQFYDSPIKSSVPYESSIIRFACFNSMIVRLKDVRSTSRRNSFLSFNSMIVRLKVFQSSPLTRPHNCFNSMIVRLKEGIRPRV